MSRLNVWHHVPINKASRPVFLDNEHSLYMKDGVGMYQGKSKIVGFQNGRVYLTNKRIMYVDSTERKAIGMNLADASRAELVERFLRSSPKVKVYLKSESQNGASQNGSALGSTANSSTSSLRDTPTAVWTCVICSYNNHVSTALDLERDELPKCVSCGIPPSKSVLGKAIEGALKKAEPPSDTPASSSKVNQCSRCTFINHPSMRNCEMCGSELKPKASVSARQYILQESPDSPLYRNSLGLTLEEPEEYTNQKPYIKISFRKGGEAGFYEHTISAIDKLKWEALEQRGGVSDEGRKVVAPPAKEQPRVKGGGIHSLQQIGEQQRKRNEVVLSSSLDDLEQLLHRAQDLIKIGSSFESLLKTQKTFVKTPNFGPSTIPVMTANKASTFYIEELARHMCEYLLNSELTKNTSMITVQGAFASYNRFRLYSHGFGTELITATEFNRCIDMFEVLDLPVKKKTYSRSGLVVLTQKQSQSQKDLHWTILEYLVAQNDLFYYEKYRLEIEGYDDFYLKQHYSVYRGCTASEISSHFGWAQAVCMEETERCIEEGLVVCDKHISGTFYFVNKFDEKLCELLKSQEELRAKAEQDCLNDQRQISAELKNQFDLEIQQSLVNLRDSYDFGEVSSTVRAAPSENLVADKSSLIGDLAGLRFE